MVFSGGACVAFNFFYNIIMVVQTSNIKITFFTDSCFRFELNKGEGFLPPPFEVSPVQEEIHANIKRVADRVLEIETMNIKLRLPFFVKFYDGSSWKWPVRKPVSTFLPGWSVSLDSWFNFLKSPFYPFASTERGIINDDGFFVYVKEKGLYPSSGWYKEIEHFEFYFSGYGSDYKRAFRDARAIFGKAPLLPIWIFGLWFSVYKNLSDQEYLQIAKNFSEIGTPLDVLSIDTDWRGKWTGYAWDAKKFPDPERFLKKLNTLGIKPNLNDHPRGTTDGDTVLKWTSKESIEFFIKEISKKFLNMGMRFWWLDGWGLVDPWRSVSPVLWTNHWYFEASKQGNKRGVVLARHGGFGGQRYPVGFSGDTPSTWEALQHQVEFTVSSSTGMAFFWSHDTGGFFGKKLPSELFLRWLQFSSVTPVFRLHSDHGIREPWNYGAEFVKIFKLIYKFRILLIPYFYTLAWETHRTGLPIVRPLLLEWPHLKTVWDEYMLGDNLLVAPVTSRDSERRVIFPPGKWAFWWDGRIFSEGEERMRFELYQIPVFLKWNSAIPVFLDHPTPLFESRDYIFECFKKIGILMAGNEAVLKLYVDDGFTRDYEKGIHKFFTFKIDVQENIRARLVAEDGELCWDLPSRFRIFLWNKTSGLRDALRNDSWIWLKRIDGRTWLS